MEQETQQQPTTQPEQAPKETSLLEWEAPEFRVYTRDWRYFVLTALVFLAVFAYSVYVRDWFIIVIVLLMAVVFYWYPSLKPKLAKYKITQLGLYINERIFPYSDIHSFWLLINQEDNRLNIIFNKKYLPPLSILLKENDPLTVKTILGRYVPEQENRAEPLIDRLMRLLKL